jgi:glycosyltransferase involved in cell wall biosynthesis
MGGMSLSLVERARRAGVPSVACVHDDWLVYGPRVDAWLATFAGRPRLARATAALTGIPTAFDADALGTCLFVSETTRRRALAGGARPRETQVAPSGIEDRFLEPGPVTSWRWRLLYVGRIDRRKGIDTAVEAVARLPGEARLTVVGEGEAAELEALREEARAAGVAGRVEFAGARPREELPALYAAHDAILFPVRWDEPWGLVPLEAMGIGRPVVATGQGGSAEYLRHEENALLFEAGDPDALAAAVTRLARDDSLRARLRAGGERTARAHTEAVFNRRVEEAIAEAVRRAARQ